MKQSFVSGLYATGQATSNYAPPGTDPDADLVTWFASINAGEPYDQNPLSQDIVDEITTHHSSYYIDDSTAPAPLLISNGWTDDLFPADEAIRFYNRTPRHAPRHADLADLQRPRPPARAEQGPATPRSATASCTLVRPLRQGRGLRAVPGSADAHPDLRRPVRRRHRAVRRPEHRPAVPRVELGPARPGRGALRRRRTRRLIAPSVSDQAGTAFDPIGGGGACATAPGADQAGTASYRLDPAPARASP